MDVIKQIITDYDSIRDDGGDALSQFSCSHHGNVSMAACQHWSSGIAFLAATKGDTFRTDRFDVQLQVMHSFTSVDIISMFPGELKLAAIFQAPKNPSV